MILSCARPNWCEVVLLSQPHFKRKWMSCSARCDQDSSLIVLYCTLVRKLAKLSALISSGRNKDIQS